MTLLFQPGPSPVPGPRHCAPEWADDEERFDVAALLGDARPGRHAEPEWARELFDPRRDEDPFDWLGFAQPA